MEWLLSINQSIRYMEEHLLDELSVEDVAAQAFASSAHFQRLFHLVTGITIGEYIRNRRLSLAGRDLLRADCRVVDVAMKYQYTTSESFSKAFARFHGISPSDVKRERDLLRFFRPLTINIRIQGGFNMTQRPFDAFCWNRFDQRAQEQQTDSEKYQSLVSWALKARGQNPGVFDALTEWVLDDAEWTDERLVENEQILMQGVFARFKEQNAQLRAYLSALQSSGVVNAAVFQALDRFDDELSGLSHDEQLQKLVAEMFADFSVMRDRGVRRQIAGCKTGPTGTDTVELFGYINYLKDCDAAVQWALFMPDVVEKQQNGFKVASFTYKKMPALRFIGREGDDLSDPAVRMALFQTLDAIPDARSGFDYDLLLMHHDGLGVDVGPIHFHWGRFMKADTPVPEGMLSIDFVPHRIGKQGPPYISHFAYATFSGDVAAMHKREGYDSDAMYDVTRNIMLGQGENIPYPDKYWTAEVFLDGCNAPSTAYLFSAEL